MKKKKVWISLLIILIAAAVAAGAYFVYTNYLKEEPEPQTQSETVSGEPTTVPAKYQEYYNKNNDFVGWITIDGTNVVYPVVQADDNEYYLTHNFDKEYESRGTIFMDYLSDPDLGYTNTVIHGHNWLDDTVFSELPQYSDIDYYREHPVIEYNTRTQMHKWKIFAVFITTASADEDNGYVFNYVYPDMGGINFDGYMAEVDKRTIYYTGVDVNSSDKFLTLSTCTREVDTRNYRADCRIVILARMVRDGESASVDTSAAYENSSPKYPQIWYDLKQRENPYRNDEFWYPYDTMSESASD